MPNIICLNELNGVGVPCSQITPLTDALAFGLLRPGFTFSDAEACDTLTDWLTAVANKDILVVPNVRGSENQTVEDGIHTTAYGDKIHLWEGKQGKRYMLTLSKDQHKILRTYSGKNYDFVIFDRNNNIHVVVNDDGTIGGYPLDYFHVFNQTEPTEADPPFTPVEFQIADSGLKSSKGGFLAPTFRVKDIEPITHITIEVSTVDTNVFTLTAYATKTLEFDSDGTAVQEPITGLDTTELYVIDQTGAENSLASCVESTVTPGTYTVTGDTLTSGSCKVKPTATSLYESDTETLAAV